MCFHLHRGGIFYSIKIVDENQSYHGDIRLIKLELLERQLSKLVVQWVAAQIYSHTTTHQRMSRSIGGPLTAAIAAA